MKLKKKFWKTIKGQLDEMFAKYKGKEIEVAIRVDKETKVIITHLPKTPAQQSVSTREKRMQEEQFLA